MSMTLANADSYIVSIAGGRSDTTMKARAREALGAAMENLSLRNDWSFLLVDTAQAFSVASCTIAGDGVSVTASSNALKNVLKGMTVTGTGVAASTTVSAVTNAGAITLSAAATPGTVTLTFGGTIPIYAGVDQYTLPSTFWKPYDCRLVSNQKWPLEYISHREYDLITYDQAQRGTVGGYTIYNGATFDASGTQQTKIKFFRLPQTNDTALLKYYRPFSIAADPVDIPDTFLYTLLNLARVEFLYLHNATDERIPRFESRAERQVLWAIGKDRNEGGEDENERIHTPGEVGIYKGDPFYPRGDYGWDF